MTRKTDLEDELVEVESCFLLVVFVTTVDDLALMRIIGYKSVRFTLL